MSIKILTKSGTEVTAIDDARAYNFDAGNKSGIVKGALNEGKLFLVSSNVIGLDSCELRIAGHRIVIDSAESITMANRPSVATRYSMIAEVVVSDASVPSFRLFIQPAKTELTQQNLYKTLNGNGTYQLRIGNFTLGSDGFISDIVRTADVISGATNGVSDIEFNVTTETIGGDLEPEVNVNFNEETKKYDMHFALPLSSGTSVIENGEVVKRFNADSKVDKEEGKGLSTNDFTTAEKNKLAGLSNYNDTSLSGRISTNAENISKLQNNKQDNLTAGNGINIDDGVIGIKQAQAVALNTTRTGQNDTVVEYYMSSDGNTWYRKWASGWKECGLINTTDTTASVQTITIALPITFSNTNYICCGTCCESSGEYVFIVKSKSTNSITCRTIKPTVNSSQKPFNIYCCGY